MRDEIGLGTPAALLASAVADAGPGAILTLPDIRFFRALGDSKSTAEWPDSLRVLATEATLAEVGREFLTATHVSDLAGDGPLDIRSVSDDTALQPLLITETGFVMFAGIGEERLCSVRTEDGEPTDVLGEQAEDLWETADEYRLRTPPYSRMLETLGEDLSGETAGDFQAVLESPQATRSVGESIDEVDVALLMGARNGQQLYHLGRWGEDAGLASSAKFSRQKRKMEEIGLIETEKVKRGVGRPRQRLLLSDDLEGMSPDEIVATAESVMS
jgi:hypothetical protein